MNVSKTNLQKMALALIGQKLEFYYSRGGFGLSYKWRVGIIEKVFADGILMKMENGSGFRHFKYNKIFGSILISSKN